MKPDQYPRRAARVLTAKDPKLAQALSRAMLAQPKYGSSERIRVGGNLQIIKRDSDGEDANILEIIKTKDLLMEGENLIVNTGLDVITRALVGFEHPTNTLISLDVGDGATGPPSNPDPPTAGDTVLGNLVRSVTPFDSTSFPATGQLLIVATIPTQTGAGETYNEAGLFTPPSPVILFARKTFAEINKDTTFSLEFRWTISFTAV